jgi:hypothetical protein
MIIGAWLCSLLMLFVGIVIGDFNATQGGEK